MRRHPRWLEAGWLGLAVCGLAASSVTAARTVAGYLPALGPAPMRFQPMRAELPLSPRLTLQPNQAAAPATNTPASEQSPGQALPNGAPLASPEQWLNPGSSGPPLPPVATEPGPAAIGAINPKSVINLLMPGPTNTLPEQFIPPAFVPPPPPLPPRASTATYEIR